jgi:hypothetical protein
VRNTLAAFAQRAKDRLPPHALHTIFFQLLHVRDSRTTTAANAWQHYTGSLLQQAVDGRTAVRPAAAR